MVKIQELPTKQLIITIPRAIAKGKNWKKGMELEYIIDNLGNILLKQKQV